MALLTVEEVRTYIQDRSENNKLLDDEEFPEPMILLAMDLALSEYNSIPPISSETVNTFKNKAILMSGTLYKLFQGQAALLFRNHMNYTDGGLNIPIEERGQFYQAMASMYQQDFITASARYKAQANIEAGWGEVRSDYANFPAW